MDTKKESYFVAIDLGDTQIRGIVAKKTDSGLITVLGIETEASAGIVCGQIADKFETAPIIGRLVSKLQNRLPAGVKITRVYIGMGGYTLRSKPVEEYIDNYGKQTELSEPVLAEIEERTQRHANSESLIYKTLKQEFLLDGELVDDAEGRYCQQCTAKFLLLSGSPALNTSINEIVRLVKKIDLVDCPVSPLALADALATADDKRQGCAVIDFGGENTSVVVYANRLVRHVFVLPFGGKTITRDLCKALKIDDDEAERLKLQYGYALAELLGQDAGNIDLPLSNGSKEKAQKIARITEARADEILDLVCREIDRSHYWGKLNAGIIISGSAARLRGIENLISLKTGMKVRRGTAEDLLAGEKEKYNRYENHLLLALVKNATEDCTETVELPKPEEKIEEPIQAGGKTPKGTKAPKPPKEKEPSLWDKILGRSDEFEN